MLVLWEHYLSELAEVNKELLTLASRSEKLKTLESFGSRDTSLSIHMELYNKDLIARKTKKFEKDRRAFSNGNAYKWGMRNIGGRTRASYQPRGNIIDTDVSSSGAETDIFFHHLTRKEPSGSLHQDANTFCT